MSAFAARLLRWLSALLLAAALPATAADVELPPVDSVFVLSAKATARDRIEVRWEIADGYYLYRHRTSVKAGPGFADARLALPDGARHRDEFFGDVETYRRQLVGVLAGQPAPGTSGVTLTVKYQGCADVGVCYPPQTRTLSVALPAGAASAEGFGLPRRAGGGLFAPADGAGAVDRQPLPADKAFASDVIALDGHTLLLRLTPAKGYYLYRDKLQVRLDAGAGLAATLPAASRMPAATPYHDEHFGDVAVYFDQVEIRVPVTRTETRAASGTLLVDFQGCQDGGICYPPMSRKLAVALPMGTPGAAAAGGGGAGGRPPGADAGVALPPDFARAGAAQGAGGGEPAAAVEDPASGAAGAPANGVAAIDQQAAREAPPKRRTPGLLAALLLALGGGLVLNLMPCVLPILSLKVLGLAQSGASRARARGHALAYTGGVLVSMLALGALVLALRKAGLALGWGFQLQQPLVLAGLALLMFVLGLSLSGLWAASVSFGARTGALLQRGGMGGDFATGVLAVVLATPCTAPFMGAALAYAFTSSTAGALLVFLMLGLGLALPFLLIGFVPALARSLPRPGPWMDTFKQLLAFPLYATAAWLLWVLVRLRGADALAFWLMAGLTVAFAAWAWGRASRGGVVAWRAIAVLALLSIAWPLVKLHGLPRPDAAPRVGAATDGVAAVPWSEQALADLRAQRRVVFVNMTADWCVTCKANEKAVFARDAFARALASANAVYMVGDYTDVDPAITAYLQRHGAVGVPLYVVYPVEGGDGTVLPTVVTGSMVEAALQAAAR